MAANSRMPVNFKTLSHRLFGGTPRKISVRTAGVRTRILSPSSRLKNSALKMETVCFSETLVSTYESTRRYNAEQYRQSLT
jgi:hypothetical protein